MGVFGIAGRGKRKGAGMARSTSSGECAGLGSAIRRVPGATLTLPLLVGRGRGDRVRGLQHPAEQWAPGTPGSGPRPFPHYSQAVCRGGVGRGLADGSARRRGARTGEEDCRRAGKGEEVAWPVSGTINLKYPIIHPRPTMQPAQPPKSHIVRDVGLFVGAVVVMVLWGDMVNIDDLYKL